MSEKKDGSRVKSPEQLQEEQDKVRDANQDTLWKIFESLKHIKESVYDKNFHTLDIWYPSVHTLKKKWVAILLGLTTFGDDDWDDKVRSFFNQNSGITEKELTEKVLEAKRLTKQLGYPSLLEAWKALYNRNEIKQRINRLVGELLTHQYTNTKQFEKTAESLETYYLDSAEVPDSVLTRDFKKTIFNMLSLLRAQRQSFLAKLSSEK